MNKLKTFPKKLKNLKTGNIFGELKSLETRSFSKESKASRGKELLKKIKADEFPLRSSLFWDDPQGGGWYNTGYKATWDLLSRNNNAPYRDRLINKQVQYNSNMMTYYLYHYDDPSCVVNPFVGCPDPSRIATGQVSWDDAEVNKWMPFIELGKIPGVWIIPSIFCGDSREATNNTAFHDMFLPPVMQALHPYIRAINLGSEMSKTMNVHQMERMIAVIKNAWIVAGLAPRFVLVHLQCDREGNLPIPSNADGIMLETSNHPKDGCDISVRDMCCQVQKAISKCPIPILVTETNIFCENQRAREQVRGLRNVQGIWCLPGPE